MELLHAVNASNCNEHQAEINLIDFEARQSNQYTERAEANQKKRYREYDTLKASMHTNKHTHTEGARKRERIGERSI